MNITKEQIRRTYPHRIKPDGSGMFGCPVCCDDTVTDDPRFGRKKLDRVGGYDQPLYECGACPVWHEED